MRICINLYFQFTLQCTNIAELRGTGGNLSKQQPMCLYSQKYIANLFLCVRNKNGQVVLNVWQKCDIFSRIYRIQIPHLDVKKIEQTWGEKVLKNLFKC